MLVFEPIRLWYPELILLLSGGTPFDLYAELVGRNLCEFDSFWKTDDIYWYRGDFEFISLVSFLLFPLELNIFSSPGFSTKSLSLYTASVGRY